MRLRAKHLHIFINMHLLENHNVLDTSSLHLLSPKKGMDGAILVPAVLEQYDTIVSRKFSGEMCVVCS